MNILILNWRDPKNPKSGGAEIVTLEHAKGWIKNGNNVTWFTSSFENAKEEEEIEKVKVIRKGSSLTVYFHAFIYYLSSRKKHDLIVDEFHGLPFFTPLYSRKPKIAFIHEVAGEIWDYMFPFPVSKFGKIFEKTFFIPYKNTNFMTVSKSTADELRKLGIKKITVVDNGINFFKLPKMNKQGKITFIFVSRVVKMKGIEDVIKSFFYIINELKDAELWIVGDGDQKYKKYLISEINTYSVSTKVKFFGKVTEKKKYELLKKSHLLLHASVKEGWGLVVVEAASQGTPSVVYNVAGLRDSVINNKTGIILKENTPSEMAKQAIKLIKNKNVFKAYQKNCLEYAKSLSWEKSIVKSSWLIKEIYK